MKKYLVILVLFLAMISSSSALAAQYSISGGTADVDYTYYNPGIAGYGKLEIHTDTPLEITTSGETTSDVIAIKTPRAQTANVTLKNISYSGSKTAIDVSNAALNLTFSGSGPFKPSKYLA